MNKADTVAIIRSLLSSANTSYNIYKLNKDFKNETGIDIPLFGYSNISDFLNSIPDTVKVTGIYPIQQISLVTNEKSSHIVSLVKSQKNSGQKKKYFFKSKSLMRKIGKNASFRSEGIQASQISMDKRYINNGLGRSNDICKNQISITADILPTELDSTLPLSPSKKLVPGNDFCSLPECVPLIDLELNAQIGEYVEVFPCQIFTPHKFFFHFRKFKKKIDDFCEEFQLFYSTHEIPEIKAEMARTKQVCAVFHKIYAEPKWHRAEIYEIINSSRVMVNFIDYGKTAEIPTKNLKLLHRKFMSFPRQAVLGFLANIRPVNGELNWSPCASKKFYELAFRKALIAGVVEVDSKSNRLGMALSCTKGFEIHINDTLVNEGYANFDVLVLDSQFTNVLKNSNLCYHLRENRSKSEPASDEMDHDELPNNCLNCDFNATQAFRVPIYFPNNNKNNKNNNNNKRLKKMFSFEKKNNNNYKT